MSVERRAGDVATTTRRGYCAVFCCQPVERHPLGHDRPARHGPPPPGQRAVTAGGWVVGSGDGRRETPVCQPEREAFRLLRKGPAPSYLTAETRQRERADGAGGGEAPKPAAAVSAAHRARPQREGAVNDDSQSSHAPHPSTLHPTPSIATRGCYCPGWPRGPARSGPRRGRPRRLPRTHRGRAGCLTEQSGRAWHGRASHLRQRQACTHPARRPQHRRCRQRRSCRSPSSGERPEKKFG